MAFPIIVGIDLWDRACVVRALHPADWWDLFYDFLGIAVAVGLIGLWWLGRPAIL